MLETTIVGSLPKPTWLADPSSPLRAPWRLEGEDLRMAQDDAVRIALLAQEDAGIDVVCDAEQRRRHYIWGFLEGLTGFDFETMGHKRARGGRYTESTAVVRIVGEVTRPAPVFLDAVKFARAHTDKPLKVTLPGPMTIVDSSLDEHYGIEERALAMHFAEILNAEALVLQDAGADVIQFDEPCFNIYLDKVQEWGIETLERCMQGVTAKKGVHICYGYGTDAVLQWKTQKPGVGPLRHFVAATGEVECRPGVGRVRRVRRRSGAVGGAGRQGRPHGRDRCGHRGSGVAPPGGRAHPGGVAVRFTGAPLPLHRLRHGAAQPRCRLRKDAFAGRGRRDCPRRAGKR